MYLEFGTFSRPIRPSRHAPRQDFHGVWQRGAGVLEEGQAVPGLRHQPYGGDTLHVSAHMDVYLRLL